MLISVYTLLERLITL